MRYILLRICWLFLLLLQAMIFSSCRVNYLPGVKPGEWYIAEDADVAMRFDEPGSGEYVNIDRAVATPQSLRVRKWFNSYRFRLEGVPNIRGRMLAGDEHFLISSRRLGDVEFRKYTPVFLPEPPFRYREPITNTIEINETVYGYAPGYYTSKTIEKRDNKSYWQVLFDVAEGVVRNIRRNELPMEMDIYQPADDTLSFRPLIVLLHAGAFIAGDKRDELVSSLAQDYARKGFVVASVNYRLGYVFLPGRYSNLERAMYSAVQDVRAALRYLSFHHQEYRIDPDMIFLAGHSAGGILSLKTSLMEEEDVWPSARGSLLRLQPDLECLDCSTNDLYGPFTIQAVVNMWGAVDNLELFKPGLRLPILSIHGDQDQVVPYGHDFPFGNVSTLVSAFFSRKIHGSASIDERARRLGLDHTLYTFEGWGHEPHFDDEHVLIPENYQVIHDEVLAFFNQQLSAPPEEFFGPLIVSADDPVADYYFMPDDRYNSYKFQCDQCLVLSHTPHSARIVWLAGEKGYELRIAGFGRHGQVYLENVPVEIR